MDALNIISFNMQSSPNVNLAPNNEIKTENDFMKMFDNVISKVNEKLSKNDMQKPVETNGFEDKQVDMPEDELETTDVSELAEVDNTAEVEVPDEIEVEDEKEVQDEVAVEVMSAVLTLLQKPDNLEEFVSVNEENDLVINTEKMPELINLVKEELPEEVVIKADDVFSEEFNLDDIVELGANFTLDEANVEIDEKNFELKVEFDSKPLEFEEVKPEVEVVDENGFLVNFEKEPELTDDEKFEVLKDTINDMIDKFEIVKDEDIKPLDIIPEEVIEEVPEVIEEFETLDKIEMPKKEIKIEDDTEIEETIEEIVPEEEVKLEDETTKADEKSDHKERDGENKDVKRININEVMKHETIKPNDAFENEITKAEEIVHEARDLTDKFLENVNVVKQMVKGVELKVSETNSEMSIKLDPENLGKVNLKIVTDNGIVTAKFEAENQRVKEIIESNLSLLKESLENKGIQINGLEVNVGQNMNGGFNQNRQNIDYLRKVASGKNPHKILGKRLNNSILLADINSRDVRKRGLFMTKSKVNYIA